MTSQAGAAGVPAVFLYKEQTTDDAMHMFSFYVRLKVLTEGGKDYANVELPFLKYNGTTIDSIAGRTIHPNGSVVAFTGKPYDKLVGKVQGYQEQEKVFTLPAVEVGSILEYRYKLHYDDAYVRSPDWFIQTDLYLRRAHYDWKPTTRDVSSDEEGRLNRVAWFPVLPAGQAVVTKDLPGGGIDISLDVHDIPAVPKESFMPPMESLSYRVMFYYTAYSNGAEYWKAAGKRWSKAKERFIGPGKGVQAFVRETVQPGDTQDQKLKKLYEAVMKLENTDFTRTRTTSEEKAAGLKETSTTDDVLARRRGSGDQLADLLVAMARAAGIKAYVMSVADRHRRVFIPRYLSLNQLDDDLAIVTVDGKEVFLDPGQRYCEYRHLAWMHAGSAGLREVEGGTAIAEAPREGYKSVHVTRIADLTLDEHGEAAGTVKTTYTGDPARRWRQEALRGDDTSLNASLRSEMERTLPGGMEVRVTNVANLTDADKPLTVEYAVKGAVGTPTGKRLLVQASLFQVNAKPLFPEPTREEVVYMPYPSQFQDAVRIKYPASLTVESAPQHAVEKWKEMAVFEAGSKLAPGSVTTFRNLTVGESTFLLPEYPELRAFYGKVETRDQDTVVLTHAAAGGTPATASGGATGDVATAVGGK